MLQRFSSRANDGMLLVSRFRGFDWTIFISIIVIGLAGLVSLASSNADFFSRQLIWYSIALIIILGGSHFDWRWFITQKWFRYGVYFLSIALLVSTNLQSETIRGTKAWLNLGGLRFEPSEFAKLALILVLAGFFSRRYVEAWLPKNILISSVYTLVPVGLVAMQPDFGSALVMVGIWFGFLLLGGIRLKRLIAGVVVVAFIFTLLWFFYLQPYQKNRILGFVFPEFDPLGVNYNVNQSKIAIGSAGFFGKGFKEGTQVQLKFLPEAQTDFLFAAFVEEWGISGGIIVLLAFIVLFFRILSVGLRARTNDFKFISLGVAITLLFHFLMNIGSNLGLLPVVGVPFPFLSYGGSNLLTFAVFISIIERIKLESH